MSQVTDEVFIKNYTTCIVLVLL